jgi:signal peptidase I
MPIVNETAPGISAEGPTEKRRRWWIAVLLSVVTPGLGHLYAGRPRTALVLLAAPILVGSAAIVTAVAAGWDQLPVINGLLSAVWGWVFVTALSAGWAAHSAPANYLLRPFNRLPVYLGAYACALLLGGAAGLVGRATVAESLSQVSANMAPTLLAGDKLFAAKIGPSADGADPGDVIVFRSPRNRRVRYVQRVIAVAGQTVSVEKNVVHIDGQPVERSGCTVPVPSLPDSGGRQRRVVCSQETLPNGASYPILLAAGPGHLPDAPALLVPVGEVFVLGDNRDDSADSRLWGTVPVDDVTSYPVTIWHSIAPDGTLRAERAGLRIE